MDTNQNKEHVAHPKLKIFKRDGSVEDFDPVKANGWGEFCATEFPNRSDWGSAIAAAKAETHGMFGIQSVDWHKLVIRKLIELRRWPEQVTAGKMYIFHMVKEMYNGVRPTVKELHLKMQELGLMRVLNYSDAEYAAIEEIVQHQRDESMAYFQIGQFQYKYALKNRKKKDAFYETPQFIMIRMAMALSEDDPVETRMMHVRNFYELFSIGAVSSPSPNYEYLGTKHHGVLSCCLFGGLDEADSLGAAAHIAYKMTLQSAGLGVLLDTRTMNDMVAGGRCTHNGKWRYHEFVAAAARSSVQGNRGGAITGYVSMYDPEAERFVLSQSVKTDPKDQLRQMHIAMIGNNYLAKQALADGEIPVFTSHSSRELWDAMFSKDKDAFERVAVEFMANGGQKVKGRPLVMQKELQSREASTVYYFNATAANIHTAFKQPIRHSNLCTEIMQPNEGYKNILDLYLEEDHGRGEISMCGIGSLNQDVIMDDEHLAEKAAYYGLRMIYKCIKITDYAFPHVRFTANARRNAALGMVGVAGYMARKGMKYDTPEGLGTLNRLGERHWYYALKASCELAKEFGPAPWIHKTTFPEGYSVLDTYYRSVDTLIAPEYLELRYDHEALRQMVIECGGGAFSTLVSHMPNESSSKVLPGSPNSYYPVRDVALLKEDGGQILNWTARDNDILEYQSAYDLSRTAQIHMHAVLQKWADGGLSADFWDNRVKFPNLEGNSVLIDFANMHKYGMKSHYYTNTLSVEVESSDDAIARMVEANQKPVNQPTNNARMVCAGGCD